jgi:Arc/MetJ-type ribon-helix-helix transcriptional regulator
MKVTLPDSLKEFVEKQLASGRYSNPDEFVVNLVRSEAAMFDRIERGEPFPIDEHFDGRLEALLDEAKDSGGYVEATKEEFDAMEREALELVRKGGILTLKIGRMPFDFQG